jgi:NADH-quinone oxidoreductase subunit G
LKTSIMQIKSCLLVLTLNLKAPFLMRAFARLGAAARMWLVVGEAVDLTYEYEHMGNDRAALAHVAGLDMSALQDVNSICIVGQGALNEADGEAVLATVQGICEKSNGKLMVLHTAASRVGAMDVGAVTDGGMASAIEGAEVIYNLGADEVDVAAGPIVIYQGSHGDRGAHRADIILPGAAYTEENGLFVNTEGRPQLAMRAGLRRARRKKTGRSCVRCPQSLGANLPYDSLAQLRSAWSLHIRILAKSMKLRKTRCACRSSKRWAKQTSEYAVRDFYLTNPIARASRIDG